jgi:hypothetical protein
VLVRGDQEALFIIQALATIFALITYQAVILTLPSLGVTYNQISHVTRGTRANISETTS